MWENWMTSSNIRSVCLSNNGIRAWREQHLPRQHFAVLGCMPTVSSTADLLRVGTMPTFSSQTTMLLCLHTWVWVKNMYPRNWMVNGKQWQKSAGHLIKFWPMPTSNAFSPRMAPKKHNAGVLRAGFGRRLLRLFLPVVPTSPAFAPANVTIEWCCNRYMGNGWNLLEDVEIILECMRGYGKILKHTRTYNVNQKIINKWFWHVRCEHWNTPSMVTSVFFKLLSRDSCQGTRLFLDYHGCYSFLPPVLQ